MANDIPETMTAVLLTGHGGPDKLDVRHDVPVAKPETGEVLIRVAAAGVNNTDIWTREGAYNRGDNPDGESGWSDEPLRFPRIQGMDAAGTIAAVGAEVSETRIGERVMMDATLYSDVGDGLVGCGFIGSERDGGFAEYVCVPDYNAVAVNSELSGAELASFPTAYVTAEGMLTRARVTGGERLVVTGASGGVGSAAVQLAKVRGAEVAAVVGPGKEDQARDLGADHVITRGSGPLPDALRSATGWDDVDVAVDVVGGTTFGELLDSLTPKGRYVTAGAIAGPIVDFDLRTLYLNHLEVIGSTMGTRSDFERVLSHIEAGRLRPLVARTYPLTEIKQAQADFIAKGFFGKLVLIP